LVLARKKAVGAEYDFTYQYALPQKKKRIVVKRHTKTFPIYKAVAGFLLIACFFATSLAYTYIKARITCLNWELSQIKRENAAIVANIEKIKLEIASSKSLHRIKYLAVSELGMMENPGIEYLVMNNICAEEGEGTQSTSQKDEQTNVQLASRETKNSIFKTIYDVIALQGIMGKG
jgi:cell division protein FtsL